jgi:SRSO17 transposase
VLADAGYGSDGASRAGVTVPGLTYAAGVQSTLSVRPPGEEPLPPVGLDASGAVVLRRRARHETPVALAAKSSPCIVGWRRAAVPTISAASVPPTGMTCG